MVDRDARRAEHVGEDAQAPRARRCPSAVTVLPTIARELGRRCGSCRAAAGPAACARRRSARSPASGPRSPRRDGASAGHTLRSSSSLPSLRTSASRFEHRAEHRGNDARSHARPAPGRAAARATIAIAPGTADRPYWLVAGRLVRPGLDLHRGAGGQGGDADGAACRTVVAEAGDVGLVERRERVHVGQEAQRLGDVGRATRRRWRAGPSGSRPPCAVCAGDATLDERAVLHPELAADDDPIAGPNDGGVRAERFAHDSHRTRDVHVADTQLVHSRAMSMSRRHFLAGAGARSFVVGFLRRRFLVRSSIRRHCRAAIRVRPGSRSLSGTHSDTFVPGKVRLPISLADQGSLLTEPTVSRPSSTAGCSTPTISRSPRSAAPIHATDLVIPYWAINVEIDQPGIYTLRLDGDDGFGAPFQITDPTRSPCRTSGHCCRRSTRRPSPTIVASIRTAR